MQAGSSYNIPKLTQQTFGTLRAADEIIDEGHFIGKALGEGMNGATLGWLRAILG